MRSGWLRNEGLLQTLFVLLAAVILVLNLGSKFILAGSYIPELGGFERNVIWGIQQILAGNPLYSNPDLPPFSLIQYMPLYYYLMAFLGKAAGIEAGDAHAVYALCRGFNLFISMLLCSGIFISLRHTFRSAFLPAAGFSVFAFLMLQPFTLSGRPDMLKSFFFLLQVLLICSGKFSRLRIQIPLSLLLSLLCFLCKQDGLTAFAVLPAALFLGRQWKALMVYIFSATGLLAIVLLLLDKAFAGNFFSNVLGALQNGISISWFMSVFSNFFFSYAFLFAPALVLSYEFIQEKSLRFRIAGSAFLLAFFPPLLASLKFGSGPNYFQEAILLACLFYGLSFHKLAESSWFRFHESRRLFLLFFFLLATGMSSLQAVTGLFLNQEELIRATYFAEADFCRQLERDFPGKKLMLLTGRQWEDNLSTLLADRIINPNRDVSAQVFEGKDGNALQALRAYVMNSSDLILITDTGQKPGFPGLDFSGYHVVKSIGGRNLWIKNQP
jgi:hypothetical protein